MASYDEALKQYNDYITGIGGTPNADTAGDFENLFRKSAEGSVAGGVGLDNPEGSWEDLFGSFQGTLDDRWSRPTLSAGGVGGDLDPLGSGRRTQGYLPTAGDGGFSATQSQLDEILGALNAMNDVNLPPSELESQFPVFEVPGENLSPHVDNTLMQLMNEGSDPLGLRDYLSGRLSSGGDINDQRLMQRVEGAREELTRGQMAALADLRATLADRGLLGLPGSAEGAELDSTVRAFEPLQRAYLANLRQAYVDESELADQNEIETLQAATGWSRDQAATRLAAATSGTDRQQVMSNIALDVLAQNADWNKFLAEFGLKREQVENEIRQGRIEAIAPVLQMFLSLISQSRGGYV